MFVEVDWEKHRVAEEHSSVTVRTPVNIALIKYWGKRDEERNLPTNSSLSLTLSTEEMYTETTVKRSKKPTTFLINGVEEAPTSRMRRLLKILREESEKDPDIEVRTHNTFPTAAGLASSASGYAALASALKLLYPLTGYSVSQLARLGSGSACRSVLGGVVQWDVGEREDGKDSVARQLFPADHWPTLRVLVCVVGRERKDVPSSEGMKRTVATSGLFSRRLENVPGRLEELVRAIRERDLGRFAGIVMRDSSEMHACCLDSYPPISYLNQTSHELMAMVHRFNGAGVRAGYTFDAGPNAFLFTEAAHVAELKGRVEGEFAGRVSEVIECRVGSGPLVSVQTADGE